MDILLRIAAYCAGVMNIVTLIIFFVRPLREKVLRIKQRDDEYKKQISALMDLSMAISLNEMTKIHKEAIKCGEIQKQMYDSFCYQYHLYKALGGNHWSARMMADMEKIKVVDN